LGLAQNVEMPPPHRALPLLTHGPLLHDDTEDLVKHLSSNRHSPVMGANIGLGTPGGGSHSDWVNPIPLEFNVHISKERGGDPDVNRLPLDPALSDLSASLPVAVAAHQPGRVRLSRLDLTERFDVEAGKDYFGQKRTYKYGDPRTHGISATLNGRGHLSFFVSAGGDKETQGGGRDMFVSLMQRIERDGLEVKVIEGNWAKGTNFDEYFENLKTMPDVDAAKLTWTGRRAAEFGFTEVRLPFPFEGFDQRVEFSKPSQSGPSDIAVGLATL